MIKKILLYLLAFVGLLSLCLFLYDRYTGMSPSNRYEATAPSAAYLSAPAPVMARNVGASESVLKSDSVENIMRRMIIRNANITLQVNDIPHAIEQITQLANASKGYVVNSDVSRDASVAGNSTATISIRVPAEGIDGALVELKTFANQVIQESVSGEDITQQYVNLQSQLENLQTAKDQLTKIMAGAVKTTDVLAVFRQLTDTQGQIDVLQGQIKYYKESVAYSLITVNLTMNPLIMNEQQTQWKIAPVITGSYHALINQMRDLTYGFIKFVIYWLPLILIWTGVALLVFWIWRKIYLAVRNGKY